MSSTDHPAGFTSDAPPTLRIGYVLKVYPRFSETFIVNEVLAHEAASVPIHIFSLRHPVEGRFHESHAAVRAPVTYLPHGSPKADDLWQRLRVATDLPGFADGLDDLLHTDVDDAAQAVALALHVRDLRITHLHAHFGSVATSVARLASRLAGVPFTFTAHAKDIFHESVNEADLRRKLSDAAATVTVSDYNLAYLQQRYGAAAERVHRVYNGVDLARFAYTTPLERTAVVAAVGRLVEKKGFGELIDAVGLLVARGIAVRCVIAGTGPLDGDLRHRIRRAGLEDHVSLAGAQPQSAVVDLVRSAAVFAAPCVVGHDGNRDGLPTVLLEAMALGTPCVSTDVTGIPEVVRHGETGLVVPQSDTGALADALARLLGHPEIRVELAARARALIERDFDVHAQAARLRQIIGAARRTPARIAA